MKIKIDRQMRILAAVKDRVKDQVTEMQRLEVCPLLVFLFLCVCVSFK